MKQRGDDYGSTLSLLNLQNGHLLLPPTHLCSEHFRPEDFESIFGYSWDIIRWSTELMMMMLFFLKMETSERHTATDLVNFVCYPTGFL